MIPDQAMNFAINVEPIDFYYVLL